MEVNTLTRTLQNFILVFGGGYGRLSNAIHVLLAILVGIDIVLLGLWWALRGGEELVLVFKKILFIGFWIWMVESFPALSKSFVDSLITAGVTAGGGGVTVSQILDPSALVGAGLDATQPLAEKLAEMGPIDMADVTVFSIGYLTIIGCFIVMAVNLFLAVLEYYLFAGVVGILLPFGLLPSTKFLAEKAIGAIVAAGIKLMVLSFVTSAVLPLVVATRFPLNDEGWSYNQLVATVLTLVGVTALSWKAPGLAASLMSGSPNLGVADVAQASGAALGAGMAGIGMATGSPSLASGGATRAAAGLAQTVYGGGQEGGSPSGASGGASVARPAVATASSSLVRSLGA